MNSDPQCALLLACGDDMRLVLHGFEAVAGETLNRADGVAAEIGQLTLLGVSPGAFDRIEFRRVGSQPLQHDAALERIHILTHQGAA
jgi:hypothetical protein